MKFTQEYLEICSKLYEMQTFINNLSKKIFKLEQDYKRLESAINIIELLLN